jgi:predicted deacetylase
MEYSDEMKKLYITYENNDDFDVIKKYINTLNEMEIQALLIAFNHLGTSFNLKKSIGFLEWIETQE